MSNRQTARQIQREMERERKSKKDDVLHLRIEAEVVKRIKSEAHARQMSVSDLIRRHLAEHFQPDEGKSDAMKLLAGTLAWADMVVARATPCAMCGKVCSVQSHAWLAQGTPPPARIVCGSCYDEIQVQNQQDAISQPEE